MADTLKKIKSGTLSRGLSIAKMSLSIGTRAAGHAIGGLFDGGDEDRKSSRLESTLRAQVATLTRELGQLKGSLMKVGQMLSMYGEQFLPPEANALLKSLQSQSPPLEWPEIEKQLRRNLGADKLAELEIDHAPLAAASLGQVHLARRRSDGERIALKVQYPGVDRAIESDIKALRSMLTLSKLIPKGPRYDELFREVQSMLHQEVDYRRELATTDEFRAAFADDDRFVIPRTFPEYSSGRVLATSLEEGIPLDSREVLGLPQARRDALGVAALESYLRELCEIGRVQTDPHFGNYRVRLATKPGEPDRLILLDFGAVRDMPARFRKPYLAMVRGTYELDRAAMEAAATELGMIRDEDPADLRQLFWELCVLITEPFLPPGSPGISGEWFDASGAYDFGRSDLPKRVAKKGAQMVLGFRMRTPPRELVFLDRKLGGMFIILSSLKCRFDGRAVLRKFFTKAT